jgi:hypothetical protein
MAGPVFQFEVILERLEAADALTFQDQMQTALHEQGVFQLLNLQIMLQRVAHLNDLIVRVNLQLLDGQAALQTDIVRLQVAHVYGQWHRTSN